MMASAYDTSQYMVHATNNPSSIETVPQHTVATDVTTSSYLNSALHGQRTSKRAA
jgi:hypothetical protein